MTSPRNGGGTNVGDERTARAGLMPPCPPPAFPADVEALLDDPALALVTVVGLDGGGRRTRVVRTTTAAESIVRRARARGCSARVLLVRLVPVSGDLADLVAGGEAQ